MKESKGKSKKIDYTDNSIMDYEGLALKQAAYDVFCIVNCIESNKLNKNFCWNTEKKRQEMLISKIDEIAKKIRANTDKERIFLLSEAKKKAEILMGEGDATANKIYAKSYSKDPDFFEFYRSMKAYKNSLNEKNTKIIISHDNDFFKNMNTYKKPAY